MCLQLGYPVLIEKLPCCQPTSTATKTPCHLYRVAKVWGDPTTGLLSSLTARKEGPLGREHQPEVGLSSKLWYTPITEKCPSGWKNEALLHCLVEGKRILEKLEQRKKIWPEAIAVSDCVSHSTLTADSMPLLRDTVRKTVLPSSSATTWVLVLHRKYNQNENT